MNAQTDSPAHMARYDNVDVLSLLDPHWLENSQAATLVRMMCQDRGEATESDSVEMDVPVLAA